MRSFLIWSKGELGLTGSRFGEKKIKFWLLLFNDFGDLLVLAKKKRRKGERKVQEVQVRATVERWGKAVFGLYLFLKRKDKGKLEECSKILRYGYLSKFGY